MTKFDIVFGVVFVVFVVIFVFFRPAREPSTAPLTGAEIAQLLTGNTLKGKGYSFFYAADGSMRGVVQGFRDTGVWSVRDRRYCVQWRVWGNGEERCWQLWRDGNVVDRKSTTGVTGSELTWHEGNVGDL